MFFIRNSSTYIVARKKGLGQIFNPTRPGPSLKPYSSWATGAWWVIAWRKRLLFAMVFCLFVIRRNSHFLGSTTYIPSKSRSFCSRQQSSSVDIFELHHQHTFAGRYHWYKLEKVMEPIQLLVVLQISHYSNHYVDDSTLLAVIGQRGRLAQLMVLCELCLVPTDSSDLVNP